MLSAGFIDGLNPCAFAAIVFLIAYLSMIQKRPTIEIFSTGMFFILGVFITYFFIGLGLNKLFVSIRFKAESAQIVYLIIGTITLILAVLSFLDFFAIRRIEEGKKAKVILQLPNYFRWKIYNFVEKYSKFKYLIPIGFFLGLIISLLEFFCTGQIYLPTIIYMFSQKELQLKAITYLLFYCLMFILPLVAIFLSLLFGMKLDRIEAIGRKHIKTVKLATGIVFLILSILMFSVV
ncbi:MAG: cytochrome c biogenesis protein CcdA [Elusimicrobiota bacterium]|nr:cytochrome c biogenesis protein CcdA [Elusimicrobiota bacterium]